MSIDVICIGELLVDLCAEQQSCPLIEATSFRRAPGGAPANVAVGVRRQGLASSFIGAVGRDDFGRFLTGVLHDEGVDVSALQSLDDVRTSLAFIASKSDGSKDILFYRHPGADMMLAAEHVDEALFREAGALHFGSISRLSHKPRAATDRARELAHAQGMLVSYDPNYRADLFPDPEKASARLLEGFERSTIAKVSDEEWAIVTGTEDFSEGCELIFDRGVELIVRSEGDAGSRFATRRHSGFVPSFAVDAVEPTGAGDAAMATLIARLLPHWRRDKHPEQLSEAELRQLVRAANAAGAIACSKFGAIPSLPTQPEIEALIAEPC